MARSSPRRPRVFEADDPKLSLAASTMHERPQPIDPEAQGAPPLAPVVPPAAGARRGIRWGRLFLSAVGGLVSLGVGIWLAQLATDLIGRQDLIGWLAIGLLALAVLAALMIVAREAWGLARLARLGRAREEADSAIRHADKERARAAVRELKRLTASRDDLAWHRARLAEHEGDIMDARELLTLAERELVAPLDRPARVIVAASARRVSVLTAISPLALVDMAFVAVENMRMLRRLATLYGARPGTLGLLRLARMVLSHIVLTGGVAIGDDLVQQLIGHGLTARLSARLGEGLFNGALTARIGIAAIDVCRPLPWIESTRPRFRDMVAHVARLTEGKRGPT